MAGAKLKDLPCDTRGMWNTALSLKHTKFSITKEAITDAPPNSRVKVKFMTHNKKPDISMIIFIEKGGGGYDDFENSLTFCKSDREGLNMYGTGATSSLTLDSDKNRVMIYADTEKDKCRVIMCERDNYPQTSDGFYAINDHIRKHYLDSRVKITVYGMEHVDPEFLDTREFLGYINEKNYAMDDTEDINDIILQLGEAYHSRISNGTLILKVNSQKITGVPVINRNHANKTKEGELMYEKFWINRYECKGSDVFELIRRNGKPDGILGKTAVKEKRPKNMFIKTRPSDSDIASSYEIEITNTDSELIRDKRLQGSSRKYIFIEVNGVIISRQEIQCPWPNIRVKVTIESDDPYLKSQPNKDHSTLKHELSNILQHSIYGLFTDKVELYMGDKAKSGIYGGIWGGSQGGQVKQRKLKSDIPNTIRRDIFRQGMSNPADSHGRCACCGGKIEYGGIHKVREYHAGHIRSENDGGNISMSNLVPTCSSCNHAMGTEHMYIWMIKKYGKDYHNTVRFVKFCEKYGKNYKI